MERLIFIIAGILIGAAITIVFVRNMAPKMMIVESKSQYDFRRNND